MNKTYVRVLMAVIAALYLVTHFIPRAQAQDEEAPAAQHEILVLGDIEVSGAFARATLPNAPVGGAYMTITNTGDTDDRLTAVASDVAGAVELHEMTLVGDVMNMRPVEDGIVIPAGETVTLAPGGLHVMFMGLNQAFVEGECVEITLTFEVAGTTDHCIPVLSTAATAPAGDDSGHNH